MFSSVGTEILVEDDEIQINCSASRMFMRISVETRVKRTQPEIWIRRIRLAKKLGKNMNATCSRISFHSKSVFYMPTTFSISGHVWMLTRQTLADLKPVEVVFFLVSLRQWINSVKWLTILITMVAASLALLGLHLQHPIQSSPKNRASCFIKDHCRATSVA